MSVARDTEDLLRTLEESHATLSAAGESRLSRECVDVLMKLRKVEMTPSILGETNAGKRLKALSKQKGVTGEVASLAKQIVSEWKAMVMAMRGKQAKDGAVNVSDVANVANVTNGGKEMPAAGASDAKTEADDMEAVDEAPTPTAANKVDDTITENNGDEKGQCDVRSGHATTPAGTTTVPEATGDTIRDKIRTRLFDALCISRQQEGVAAADEGPLASAIEKAMFETLEGTSAKYKSKFQQLHFNLKDAKNPDLRRKVVTGEIDPKALLHLSPEDLASDAKREENQRIRDKKLFDAAPSQAKKATTDQFQCGKCRQRKCTYYQMQTRSADEPMTTFVSCLNCGNRWKFC